MSPSMLTMMNRRAFRNDSAKREPKDQARRGPVLDAAALLRRVLQRDAERLPTNAADGPFLLVLTGLPGTGKSHLSKRLQRHLPLLVLESDRLRKVLAHSPKYTPDESSRLFSACHLLIEEFLGQGRQILFDATNLTEKFRQPLRNIAARRGVPFLVVRCTAPVDLVRRRLADRGAGAHPSDYSDAGWRIYSRMHPYEEAVEGRHLNVDTSLDILGVEEEVVNVVKSGLPRRTSPDDRIEAASRGWSWVNERR